MAEELHFEPCRNPFEYSSTSALFANPAIRRETFGGTTALMAAAGINWVVDQTYDEGQPALLEAVKLRYDLGMNVNDSKYLVEKGAKLDAKDKEGRTPLNWAEGVFLATHPAEPKPSFISRIKTFLNTQK